MKMKQVAALSALLLILAVAASPAVAAAPEITLTVNGEDVSDGDTIEVEDSPATVSFNVSSGTGISFVQREHGSTLDAEGLTERQTYRDTFNVSVFGEREVTVEATDTGGETRTVTFLLSRPSEAGPGLRERVDNVRERANRLENETSELEQRRQELRERREELRQRRQQLSENQSSDGNGVSEDGNGSDGTDGGGQGMPGFTAVVALVAVSVAALSLRKRR